MGKIYGYEQANQDGTQYNVVLDDLIICTCEGDNARSMAHQISMALTERDNYMADLAKEITARSTLQHRNKALTEALEAARERLVYLRDEHGIPLNSTLMTVDSALAANGDTT